MPMPPLPTCPPSHCRHHPGCQRQRKGQSSLGTCRHPQPGLRLFHGHPSPSCTADPRPVQLDPPQTTQPLTRLRKAGGARRAQGGAMASLHPTRRSRGLQRLPRGLRCPTSTVILVGGQPSPAFSRQADAHTEHSALGKQEVAPGVRCATYVGRQGGHLGDSPGLRGPSVLGHRHSYTSSFIHSCSLHMCIFMKILCFEKKFVKENARFCPK